MKNVVPKLALIGHVVLFAAVGYPAARATAAVFETRCGWFDNPTPANVWFYDRDGEWTIGVQGGYQVEEIKSSRARPLSACRKDRALKRWAGRLD